MHVTCIRTSMDARTAKQIQNNQLEQKQTKMLTTAGCLRIPAPRLLGTYILDPPAPRDPAAPRPRPLIIPLNANAPRWIPLQKNTICHTWVLIHNVWHNKYNNAITTDTALSTLKWKDQKKKKQNQKKIISLWSDINCKLCNCYQLTDKLLVHSTKQTFSKIGVGWKDVYTRGSWYWCAYTETLQSLLSWHFSWPHLKMERTHIRGLPPEWCISTIYHCRDIPFWLETLDIQAQTPLFNRNY